jgi:hypothetical protein
MKKFPRLVSVLATLLMGFHTWASSATTVKTGQISRVIKTPGTYKSPGAKCPISLSVSDEGGFTQLQLRSKSHQHKVVNDVTGAAYFSDESLVYTASPIYGSPGVFVYDCASKSIIQVVKPKIFDKAYPQGSDYFELYGLEGRKIYFYYSPDVDQTDFDKFRTKEFLFEVLINGSSLKKSAVDWADTQSPTLMDKNTFG